MKPREYCCCAIPLVNAGIYTALTEQLALGVIVGTLSVATQAIVGASTPSYAKWILAAVCYVAAAIQIVGFMGVARNRISVFSTYLTLNALATIAAFSVAAVWIILSGTRHSTAQSTCENNFYNGTSGSVASEGVTLCNIFAWVDLGVMAGLWVVLLIMQGYMYFVVSSYSKAQKLNDLKRDGYYDSMQGLTSDIPMTHRDPWDGRPSLDYREHKKNDSNASNMSADHLVPHGEYDPSHPVRVYEQHPQHYTDHDYQPGYDVAGGPQRTQPPYGHY